MRLWGGLDRLARGADLRGATPSAPGEGQRRNSRFTVVTATPTSTVTALLAIPGIVLLFALPAFASRALLQELFYVFIMLALAQLWNLLAGCAGLVSVGQQAFVGVGAYFAIGTWVVAEVCRLVLAQVKQLGGGTGTSLPTDVAGAMLGLEEVRELFAVRGPAARDILAYWLALVLAAGTFMLVYRLLRSRYGLALSAIGDAEAAAESAGVDVFRTKLLIYVVTAIATGMVGALIFLQKARISPDAAFSLIDWTAYVIFIVVIGGIGSMEGPVIGVLIFYLLQYYLAALGSWYLIILGALAILLMLFAPSGVWGVISHTFDISLFPVRRRLIVPGDKAKQKEGEA